MRINIRPLSGSELIDIAERCNGILTAVLSVPLSVLIDMGEQKTRDHDPEYMEMYVHEKLICRSNTDECLSEIAGLQYMVVGCVNGTGDEDDCDAPEGEVLIKVTGNIEDIVDELKEEQRQDEKHGLHPEHDDVAN